MVAIYGSLPMEGKGIMENFEACQPSPSVGAMDTAATLVRAQLIRQVQQRASQPCHSPGDRKKTILPYVLNGYSSTSSRQLAA
jgi:hypothetical protein